MKRFIYLFTIFTEIFLFSNISLPQTGLKKVNQNIQFNIPFKENLTSRKNWEFARSRDPRTNEIPYNIRKLELQYARTLPTDKTKMLEKSNVQVPSSDWQLRGPYNQGGRSRALAADVANPNILLAGGASGGMWRSTDNGASWKKVSDPQSLQTVSCIVQDTRKGKTNIWYYGTGEGHSNLTIFGTGINELLGNGIFKSTDDGVTWTLLQSTTANSPNTFIKPFQIIWKIAIDTTNTAADILYAATQGAIYRSSDGGDSWNIVLGSDQNNSTSSDVEVTSGGDVYATLSNGNVQGVWHSNDGINWTGITPAGFPTVYNRIVIASAPTNKNLLYLLANTPNSGMSGDPDNGTDDYHNLWKYDASSQQWTDLTNNLPAWSGSVGGFSSQMGYDMVIKVKPDDENFVIIGGTNLYRTTNGFSTQLDSTNWIGGYSPANDISSYPNQHPDEHGLFFLPSNPNVLYSANDGGLSVTNDVTASTVNWTSLNNGFVTTQFYSVAIDHATTSPYIIGGMQDNGNMLDTVAGPNTSWFVLPGGGDGCISAVADNFSYFYYAVQNGHITRGTQGNPQDAVIMPSGSSGFLFETPYVLDPTNTNVMYLAAGSHIWMNNDLSAIPAGTIVPTSTNWTDLAIDTTQGNVTAFGTSRTTNHILYYGTDNGTVFRIDNIFSNNYSVNNITGQSFPQGAYVSAIATDPQDKQKVLVAFSNYNVLSLFYSTDGGKDWQSVGGNLEQNPDGTGNGPSVRTVDILQAGQNNIYLAGTTTGLYAATQLNGMSTQWIQQGDQTIGNVDVEAVDVRNLDGTVVIGTFGDGVYSYNYNVTSVKNDNTNLPETYSLSQNYPNPFNPSTVINYHLAMPGYVTLKVFDVLGNEVMTLVNQYQNKGEHNVEFNASNLPAGLPWRQTGRQGLASGIYIYRINTGNFIDSKKMMLLK